MRRNRAIHGVLGSCRRIGIRLLVPTVTAASLSAAGCGLLGGGEETAARAPASIAVRSDAFGPGERIPVRYSCQGANVSPPLRWSGVPDHADELALVVDDTDAPGGTYVHWVVFGIDPETNAIRADTVPPGAKQRG